MDTRDHTVELPLDYPEAKIVVNGKSGKESVSKETFDTTASDTTTLATDGNETRCESKKDACISYTFTTSSIVKDLSCDKEEGH